MSETNLEQCPNCGSTDLALMRKDYSPGCGCLGMFFFGWWGLLLGLLGMGEYEMVCKHCGSRWPVGKPQRAHGSGCLSSILQAVLLFIILLIVIRIVFSFA